MERKYTGLEIAIVGIGCRFPGADNWREYWENLTNDVESVEFLSNHALAELGVSQANLSNRNFVKARVVLKDKDLFDFSFFKYSPSEALLLNPLHRVFHQCVWEALEDAGYDPEQVKGLTGLYAGAGDDLTWKVYSALENWDQIVDNYTAHIINNKDYLSSLVSYKLNLKGPAFTVNTACSTSLVAINLACKSLLLGEVRMALAGGVSLSPQTQKGYFYQEGMIFSADGHCKAFDKDASGTMAGEGAGVVVLKRLTDAVNDGDHIYAIIKGSAINNDGNRKVGFTAPSVEAQAECIRKAQIFAKVDPETVTYIEAHGTATRLGDPVELEALNIAFNRNTAHRCALGSVKTNIGHLDTAAGVAGLIKTALALKYRKIPASLHFKEPNPEINFNDGPFYVNDKLREWTRVGDNPLRAGVNSLGIGGTNAHVVLEEAPVREDSPSLHHYKLLTLSANTADSLLRYTERLKSFLQKEPDINLPDLSYTLQAGRRHFSHRLAMTYSTREELTDLLQGETLKDQIVGNGEAGRKVVFMFPGQGSQYAGMGKDLYEMNPYFRQEMDKGFTIIQNLTGADLRNVLFPATAEGRLINETRYAQPILFLIEYSLARLLISIGITPRYMIGHSIGEYAAACLSGVFSFEDTLRLVLRRGELMNSVPGGSMLSVPITAEEAGVYVNGNISLAAVNGPEQVVLSGDTACLEELKLKLDGSGIPYITLHTSHAFHSEMQDGIMEDFRKTFEAVKFNKLTIPFLSNLSGNFIRDEEAGSADYWVYQMRRTVRFSDGIKTLLSGEQDLIFIEVGAGHALTSLLKQQRPSTQGSRPSFNLIRSIKEDGNDAGYFTHRIGQLWSHGVQIDWSSYYGTEKRCRIPLPTYSFQPIRYPTEVDPFEHKLFSTINAGNRGGGELKDYIYYPFWKRAVLHVPDVKAGRKTYLFFSFNERFSQRVGKGLLEKDNELVEVFAGEGFEKVSKYRYVVDPVRDGQMKRLFQELRNDGVLITDIIYAWTIGVDASSLVLENTNKEINLVYFCIVRVIQALLQNGDLKDKRVFVLTNALHKVIGVERGSYVSSLALGVVNVLPQEYAVPCCNIDINLDEPLEELADSLTVEINHNDGKQGRAVALRYGQRWVRDYQKNPRPVQKGKSAIRKGGLYLITGGLGNLGFVLAKYLIQVHEARVVLTGRKMGDPSGRLDQLRNLSKEVIYFSADISDPEALGVMVKKIENDMGPVQGVIHTAGIIDNNYFELIEDITPEKALAMFAPKVKGIVALYEVFRHRDPDFVWISSSIASLLGGLGFTSYSSANLFMDHFICSGPDTFSRWKCIGLAEMDFSDRQSAKSTDALTPQEITALFEWSLLDEAPVIIETKRDLVERIHEVYEVKKEAYLNDNPYRDLDNRRQRPALSTKFSAANTATEIKLKDIFEKFLGIESIGVEDNFFELGGDSLKGMMLLKRIRKEFDINLVIAELFKHQTVRNMALFIDEIRSVAKDNKRSSKIVV